MGAGEVSPSCCVCHSLGAFQGLHPVSAGRQLCGVLGFVASATGPAWSSWPQSWALSYGTGTGVAVVWQNLAVCMGNKGRRNGLRCSPLDKAQLNFGTPPPRPGLFSRSCSPLPAVLGGFFIFSNCFCRSHVLLLMCCDVTCQSSLRSIKKRTAAERKLLLY